MLKGKKEIAYTCSGKTHNNLEQNTHSSNEWTCTCCHKTNSYRRHFIKYIDNKYNHSIKDISRSLMHHYTNPLNGEFICQSCDRYLSLGKMPPEAAESPTKRTTDMCNECSCCKCTFISPSHILDNTTYRFNKIFAKIQQENPYQTSMVFAHLVFTKLHNPISCKVINVTIYTKKIKLSHMPIIWILFLVIIMNT